MPKTATNIGSSIEKNNQNIPEPVSAIALIDTGATNSVLKPEIIKKLGLNPIDKVLIATPSCYGVECYQYHAAIMFPNNVIVETSTLIEAPLEGQTINCLIGRDILRHSVFIYNGYVEMLTLSF